MALTVTNLGPGIYSVLTPPQKIHRVDLRAYGWNGSCTCPAFTGCARFVLTHQGDSQSRESTRCVHIMAVRDWIMDNEYPALVERAEKIIELPTNANYVADSDAGG